VRLRTSTTAAAQLSFKEPVLTNVDGIYI